MFDAQTVQAIDAVAVRFGFDPASLLAVADTESDGVAFGIAAGRQEPLIRFEGRYFDRRLSGAKQAAARAAGLANPNAGAIPNPRSQAARWAA